MVYIPCRSLVEAVYTLNSPPVVSFNPPAFPLGARWVVELSKSRSLSEKPAVATGVEGLGFRGFLR